MSEDIDQAKRQVAIANRILSYVGLASGVRASLGHVSMRLPNDPTKFLVKGRGYRMDIISRMRPEDMVTCDLEGRWVDGPEGSMPCNEVKMHSCIYQARPDVLSVVHVHPTFSVVLSTIGQPIRPIAQEGIQLVRQPLPVYPHTKTVVTDEEGKEVAKLLGDGNAVLLMGHGSATVGRTPEESVMRMIHLEHQAQMTYYALSAMGPNFQYIPDNLIEELIIGQNNAALPHFKERAEYLSAHGFSRRIGGNIWGYLEEMVSPGL
jgi:ribulose-5-phosphate 4-epimerase/fuculose-1-phosphate aldolase